MIQFQYQITYSTQIIIPLILAGALGVGCLFSCFIYRQIRQPIYLVISFFLISSFGFSLFEGLTNFFCDLHIQKTAMQMTRMEQVSATLFLSAIPLLIHCIFGRDHPRTTRILVGIGVASTLLFVTAAFLYPDSFISITRMRAFSLIKESEYGRGKLGPLYMCRDILLGTLIIFTLFFIKKATIARQYKAFVAWVLAGLTISILCGMADILNTYFQFKALYFHPVFDFSYTMVGTSLFGILVMAGSFEMFIKDMKNNTRKYRRLFENVADAVIVSDARGQILDVNSEACSRYEYEKPDFLKMNLDDLFLDPKNNKTGSLSEDGSLIYTSRHKTSANEHILIETHAKASWHNGRKIILSILRDISRQKEIERQLRQSQKMEAIGTLAGGIAHDFNNILSGIFGYSQLITMNRNNPDSVIKNVNQLIKGAQRASDLVKQILTFSKQKQASKCPVKLYLIVKEAIQFLRSSIPSTIEIHDSISTRAAIMIDPTQAHQVVINLCTNAYHAMEDQGGILSIALSEVAIEPRLGLRDEKGPHICLEIKDSGSGMDAETLEKIFDPYFTTKRSDKGTGLGLAMVDGIVKEHKGFIRVTSRIGQGTCFQVFWPIIDQTVPPAVLEEKKNVPGKGHGHIMVVDDEAAILETCQMFLTAQGYRVTTFENGVSALQAFKDNPTDFDLIITDMTMPHMTGDELAAQILKIRKDLPVILCTGFSEAISKDQAVPRGIQAFIPKPLVMETLYQTIRKLMDH